jgi:hypothetical protein
LGDFRPNRPSCFHPSNLPYGNQSFNYGYNEYGNDKEKKTKADKEMAKNMVIGIKRMCGSPPLEQGAISWVEGRPVDHSSDFRFN